MAKLKDTTIAGTLAVSGVITAPTANTTVSGLMSAADKTKLNGIAVGANNYTHPNDANTRHATDAEKTKWNTAATQAGTWNTFKAGGGTIGGRINLPDGDGNGVYLGPSRICNYKGSTIIRMPSVYGGQEAGLNIGDVISPARLDTTLGTDGVPFKDIYLSGISKNTNGYTKLPNGMIIQWGEKIASCTNGNLDNLVNFPISFPNAVLFVDVNMNNLDGDDSNILKRTIAHVGNRDKSIFWARAKNIDGYGSMCTFSWIAIGY